MLAFPLPQHLIMFQGVEALPGLILKPMEQPHCPHRISMSRVWEIPPCCLKPLSSEDIYLQTTPQPIPQPILADTDKKISGVPLMLPGSSLGWEHSRFTIYRMRWLDQKIVNFLPNHKLCTCICWWYSWALPVCWCSFWWICVLIQQPVQTSFQHLSDLIWDTF